MTKKLSNREKSEIEKLKKLFKKIYIRLVRIIYSSIFSFLEEFLNGSLENVRKGNGNEWEMEEGSEERVKKDLYNGGGRKKSGGRIDVSNLSPVNRIGARGPS